VEIEKTLTVAAPRARVWELLLDPKIMAGCVPGTQSVEVISDVEYVADVKVKISFIAARFKIRTKIVQSRPPEYLRMEGTGEDSSVASAMKQSSELFLTDLGNDQTEIRIKATADVMGRLGSFGLSVMKTKADRMWDEFGANFAAVLASGSEPGRSVDQAPGGVQAAAQAPAPRDATSMLQRKPAKAKWWQRIAGTKAAPDDQFMPPAQRRETDIYMELHRPNGVIKVLWPASAAAEAARWLKDMQ
jgi:carbon monoxide dehydrogenase subunit G